ncbi:ABC-type multidrug transport system, ATPase component [Salinarchaeum sp. Harcht-Bsk1]|uniref:ABC transporter ATP-binding protein n=1 Tax=Salinarchaeum sp. Harcht-Bsk1 TaxID=1333523 RepID=UPI00034234D1|nr:ABC transporter ATP-binding protein [Salinarchaeum sp. Harcht-Bsk1]AGN00690.1 ABC-type multidrug transport system, ATPase component [Salinarchaeum sp. Harcht-Bsk1]
MSADDDGTTMNPETDDERSTERSPSDAGDDDSTLSLREVSFAFGSVTVLEDATLDLDAGTLTALVGPNGSGKTTVLELLAGLRSPNSGSVSRPGGTARSVAYLPQTPQFRSGFTARETLSFYMDLVDDERSPTDLLERVGLEGAADRRVEALSGGMTRLLGVAQALVGDPPVVVLDEPTSGLDPDVADHIFATVEAIARDGRTVVIASHDLEAIEETADRVVTLVDGRFVQDGAPADVVEATGASTLRAAFSDAVQGAERKAVQLDAPPTGGDS